MEQQTFEQSSWCRVEAIRVQLPGSMRRLLRALLADIGFELFDVRVDAGRTTGSILEVVLGPQVKSWFSGPRLSVIAVRHAFIAVQRYRLAGNRSFVVLRAMDA